MANTVVGLFDDYNDAQEAVRELLDARFPREDISIIVNDVNASLRGEQQGLKGIHTQPSGDVGSIAGMGAMVGGMAGFLLGMAALAIPGIGPVIAAGPLVAGLSGAGLGALAGGLLGALADAGVSKEDANIYAEGVRRGGTLVTVYASETLADHAAEVLNRHNPVNIEQRVNEWSGWDHFDEQGQPFVSSTEPHAEGLVLDGTPFEAEGAQQPKRALPADEPFDDSDEKERRARIYSGRQ